jgi:hypothetical protein
MTIFILQIEIEKNMPLIVKVAGINTAGNKPERKRRNKMRKGELTLTMALYTEKGQWGYSLPELGLNFGNGKSRNQALKQMLQRIWQCCAGDEEIYGEEIYNRAAGCERGE